MSQGISLSTRGRIISALRAVWQRGVEHPWLAALIVFSAVVIVSFVAAQRYNLIPAALVALVINVVLLTTAKRKASRNVRLLLDLEFTEIDLSPLRRVAKPEQFATQLSDFILNEEVCLNLVQACRSEEEGHNHSGHFFTLVLPRNLGRRSVDARSAWNQLLINAMAERIAQRVRPDNKADHAVWKASSVRQVIHFDILVLDGIPDDMCYWLYKRKPEFPGKIEYIIRRHGQGGKLWQREEDSRTGEPTLVETETLPVTDAISVLVGRDDPQLLVTDITSDRTGIHRQYQPADIFRDAAIMKTLGIRMSHVHPALLIKDAMTSQYKGSIQALGIYKGGAFNAYGEKILDRLDTRWPNVLISGTKGYPDGDVRDLLPRLKEIEPDFSRAVADQSNFIVQYKPIQEGSPVSRYYLTPKRGSTFLFYRKAGQSPDAFKDLANYKRLTPDEEIEPAARCYLLTGSFDEEVPENSILLCLEADFGSPTIVRAEGGVAIHRGLGLRQILESYAERRGHSSLEDTGSAGIVCRSDDGTFLKLIDPTHVARIRLGDMIERMVRSGLIPDSTEMHYVNRRGGPADPENGILIIESPTYSILRDDTMIAGPWSPEDLETRLGHFRSLVEFVQGILTIGISCPDLRLKQVAVEGGRFFVCDYGAYLPSNSLCRDFTVKRVEMEAPEDRIDGLPFEPEPYHVHILGVLLLQLLWGDAGVLIEVGSAREDEAEYEAAFGRLIDTVRRKEGDAVFDLVARMLAWNPEDRPSLDAVNEALASVSNG